MKAKTGARDYTFTLILNLVPISFGGSRNQQQLTLLTNSTLNHPSMSPMAESILESLLAIGAISGTVLFRYFGDRFGLKTSLLINAVTLIVGWTLTILAPHDTSLVPQLVCGFAAGGIFYLTPIFLQEITEDHIRETLIASILLSCNCGIVTMFIMPDYCSFKVYSALFLAIPSAYFFVVLFYQPETTAPFGGFEDDEKELPLYNSNKNYRCYGCLLQRQSSEESSDGSCEYSNYSIVAIPFLVVSEMFPRKIIRVTSTFSMVILYCFCFLSVKCYPLLSGVMDSQYCFLLFGGTAVFATVSAVFLDQRNQSLC